MTDRTSTSQRTPTAEVEAAVLDAAERLVATSGPGALSIRGLASEAGVAPMSIYNRFGDKAGVLLALFVRGFRDLHARITVDEGPAPITTPEEGLDLLRRSSGAYRRFALASPGTYSLMFEQGHNEVEPDDEAMEHAAAAFFALVRQVEAAQGAGAIVGGNAAELAQRLWATIHGAVSLEIRQIRFFADPDAHFNALVDTMLAGLHPDHGVDGLAGPLVQPRTGAPLAVPR